MNPIAHEKFFDRLTLKSAYLLGLLMSDGFIHLWHGTPYYVGINTCDQHIAETFRQLLAPKMKYFRRAFPDTKRSDRFECCLGSKHLVNRLIALGCTPAKSKTLTFPNLPDNLIPAFMLGVIDGDGHIQCRESKFGRSARIQVAGASKDFFDGAIIALSRIGITAKITNLHVAGYSNTYYQLRLNPDQTFKLYKVMYNRTTRKLALPRKMRALDEFCKQKCCKVCNSPLPAGRSVYCKKHDRDPRHSKY